ncbi:hypothetical protein, partial [Mycobacterium sp. E3298]|uniref:hypothetical protein n=1 Tax=Mycobacterium sp. E3298 TaxID=1856865 RepID=UPI0018D3EADE
MTTTRLSDRFAEHLRAVQTLVDAGIPAPKEWQALQGRFTAYRALQLPACDRLTAAIINPSKSDD